MEIDERKLTLVLNI